MKAARLPPASWRPTEGSSWLRWLRLLVPDRRRDPDGLTASAEPTLGRLEAQAVERALLEWVRLQKSESTPVPMRRIDSR